MSIHPADLVLLSAVAFAALMGILWLSHRINAASTANEMPTLRLPRLPKHRRASNDNNEEEEPPISGIRLKLGAKPQSATLHRLRAPRH